VFIAFQAVLPHVAAGERSLPLAASRQIAPAFLQGAVDGMTKGAVAVLTPRIRKIV
jgi:hypothetical protein